jgi:hypothetical protein
VEPSIAKNNHVVSLRYRLTAGELVASDCWRFSSESPQVEVARRSRMPTPPECCLRSAESRGQVRRFPALGWGTTNALEEGSADSMPLITGVWSRRIGCSAQ